MSSRLNHPPWLDPCPPLELVCSEKHAKPYSDPTLEFGLG